MELFQQLKQNAKQISQTASVQARKAAEIIKLKEQIRRDKREIREITYKIGKTYIRLHPEHWEEEYAAFFEDIRKVKEDLARKEKDLQKVQEGHRCTECGAEISMSADYCPKCGAAVAYDTELKEEEELEREERELDAEEESL